MEKLSSNKEVIDSQILAENVGFLENDFDTSFSLQKTLITVKEYVIDEENFYTHKENKKLISLIKNKCNDYSQDTIFSPDISKCSKVELPSQCRTDKEILSTTRKISKNLKDWGLPLGIAEKYEERHIVEMFDWQVECLSNPKVLLDYNNLVYSAPTSAGKTLVAEILTIKTVLERQRKVIIILPFVSIVREKMFYLQDILSSSGIRVEGFMGSQSPPGGLQAVHIAICTIEKANSLLNKLLDEGNISELGAVVVDELHLLGDSHRGYILELLLTKIKFVSSKLDNVSIQIIGMSATLPNLDVLANWLDAELFVTDFRPIPLDEYCLVGTKLFDKTGKLVSTISSDTDMGESDNVLKICLDTISDGCSVLIFCMTKNRCENLAQTIASSFYKLGSSGVDMGLVLRNQLKTESIFEVLEQLKNCSVGMDYILKTTISFGVAYHHAGLTFDERDIIEGGFKSGAIRVLVATSTLSSGVNLPARKVIVRSPVFQRQPINILTYKQMIGRAGRMGRDTKGESILICSETEKKIGFELMMGALDPVESCINTEDKYMRAVLEMIASQIVSTKTELDLYSKCTLLFVQQNKSLSQNMLLNNTLDQLINYELVRIQGDGEEKHYIATPLGKACLSSSMAPNDGLSLFCELQKARQCLVLETDLHLIYLVTPYSVSSQWGDIDWLHLLTLWESLTRSMKRVGELVGVQESFIIRNLRGNNKLNNVQNKMNIHKRFYTALALQDLVNEVPLSEVAAKFQCARGFLQSLQQAAATFAGMVTAFCRQLGWKNMEMLISQFQDRLHFGIHSELVELMKLPTLNGVRARTLFDSGYESIASIACADANAIENALHKSVPFQSTKGREGDDYDDIRKRNKIRNIWITGCCGMTAKEAAENLISEARKYLKLEIGVADIKWEDISIKNVNNSQNVNVDQIHKSDEVNFSNHAKTLLPTVIRNRIISQKLDCSSNLQTAGIYKNNQDKNTTPISQLNKLEDDNKNAICKLINNDEIFVKGNNNNNILGDEIANDIVSTKVKIMNCNLSKVPKDEIAWDSLIFNETTENCINIGSVNIQSPNLSFGDSEDKPPISEIVSKKISPVNDISLFSSESDNSSLFEESLPLDSITSKLFNKEITLQLSKENKSEITSGYINVDSDTFLNAFKSTIIDVEADEDIKLIYDDENRISENELEVAFNVSEEVANTSQRSETSIRNIFISPQKRRAESISNDFHPAKKIKIAVNKCYSVSNSDLKLSALKLDLAQSMKYTVVLDEFKFDYVILREEDVIDNIDILSNLKEASVYVSIYRNTIKNEVIGSKVLQSSRRNGNDKTSDSIQCKLGICICYGQECVLLDLTLLDNKLKQQLCQLFQNPSLKLKVLSLRNIYIHMKQCFHIDLVLPSIDICLFEWLLNSDEKIPDIMYLTKKYCGVDLANISIKINNTAKKFNELDIFEDACIRAWCIWAVAEKQEEILSEQYNTIKETLHIEIQVMKILSNCEFQGLSVDKDLASQLLIDVKTSQETLQKKAYKICGYHFNFNSSKDVAKVLGIYKGRKVSTKKSVLTSHNTPISSIVMYWRKLNSILTKTLYPLAEKACVYSVGDRINPSYTMFTCTGRVSMHEPNLQNVPRTFSIPVKYLTANETNTDDVMEFNCRNIFRAGPGHLLVSADYCQLEMRILTHYSEDPVLMKIMKSDVDVFKSIAASWSNVPEDEVDDDLRQKAKQLCYGILYGMGNRTLAQHLDVTELEAAMFMDSFFKTYPSVRTFTETVIDECRKNGYVKTLMNRKRFLPDINSNLVHKKTAAERQAVNTTIQGSAADIAKAAMCAIDKRTGGTIDKPCLILQMHDELIYEVPESKKASFITLIREVMEDTVRLKVPLPVKVKCGYKWGSLEEIKV